MLTRKHFIELANIIADVEISEDTQLLRNSIIDFCVQQNPNFDVNRFEEWIDNRQAMRQSDK